jgi:hypothetical protein
MTLREFVVAALLLMSVVAGYAVVGLASFERAPLF